MADNLPISLQTGFDPSIDYAFKQDTINRLNSVFSGGGVPTTKYPNYNVNQILTGAFKPSNDFDLNAAYFSNDPNQRRLAEQSINKSLQSDIEYQQGINVPTIYAYDTSMNKYLSKDLGYRPDEGIANTEDFYFRNIYQQQGILGKTFDNVGKFLGRTAGGAVFKLGESLGYLGSIVNPTNWNSDFFANVADNSFSRYLEEGEQSFKDNVLPVYKALDYNNKGLFSKMADPAFWTDSTADGLAFLLSAAVPGVGLSKIGSAARLAGTAGKVSRLLTGADTIGGIGGWALNTAGEAAMESSGVFKSYKEKLLQDRTNGVGEFKSDSQIEDEAAKMARNTFLGNLAILALPNAFENSMIFQKIRKGVRAADNALPLAISENLTAYATKTLPTSQIGKLFSSTGRLGFYRTKSIQALGAEGLWEENAQLALQRLNDGTSNLSFQEQYLTQIKNAFSGDDPEAAESIALGGIIGSIGVGVASKRGNERRKELRGIQAASEEVNKINGIRHNWLSLNDIYETNSDGQVVFQEGEPVVDIGKVNLKGAAYNAVADSMKAIDELTDPNLKSFYSKEIFKEYVRATMKAGAFPSLLGRLTNFSNRNEDEILAFGFDPTTIQNNPEDLRRYAEQLANVELTVDKMPISDFAKTEVYNSEGQTINLLDYIKPFQEELIKLQSQLRNIDTATLSDIPADAYNSLNFQVEAYKQANSVKPSSFYTDRIAELEIEKLDILDVNQSFMDVDLTKTDDGFYINQQQLYKPASYDYFNTQRKLAEIKNTIEENNNYVQRLINPATTEQAISEKVGTLIDSVKPKVVTPVVKTEITPEEYEFFTKTGQTTPEMLDVIAQKLNKSEELTQIEKDIFEKKPEEVNTRVQEINLKAEENLRNNTPANLNPEYKGKVAYLTPFKTTIQEVDIRGMQEIAKSTPYQDFIQTYLLTRLKTDVEGGYQITMMPDRTEWEFNKSVGTDGKPYTGPLGTVIVITDVEGTPIYFDRDYNAVTQTEGRPITYTIDSSYTSKQFNEKISTATRKGMFKNGVLVIPKDKAEARESYLILNNELASRRDEILKKNLAVPLVLTSIQANNEAPIGNKRPAQEVFGTNPTIITSQGNFFMVIDGIPQQVQPATLSETNLVDDLTSLYKGEYNEKDAIEVRDYLNSLIKKDTGKVQEFSIQQENDKFVVRMKYAGKVRTPEEFENILKGKGSDRISPTFNTSPELLEEDFTVLTTSNNTLNRNEIPYKEFINSKFTTNLVGTPTSTGGITYRPLNSYFTFDFQDNIGKPVTTGTVAAEEQEVIPLDLTPEGIAANPNIIVYNQPVAQPDEEIILFDSLNAVERVKPDTKYSKKDANTNVNVVDRNRIPYQVTVFADPDVIKYIEEHKDTLTYRAVITEATKALLNDKMILDLRGLSPAQILERAVPRGASKKSTEIPEEDEVITQTITLDRIREYKEFDDLKGKGILPGNIMHFNQGSNYERVTLLVDPEVKTKYSSEFTTISGKKEFRDNLGLKQIAKAIRDANVSMIVDLRGIDLSGKLTEEIVNEVKSSKLQVEEISEGVEPSQLIKTINSLKASVNTLFNRQVDVVTDTEEIDQIKKDDPRFNKLSPDVKVLGFYKDGIVYIDTRVANDKTALHEFSHLWNDIIKENNREFYDKGLELIAGSTYYDRVKELYPELTSEESIREEALVRAIADKGAELENKDTNPIMEWLRDLWNYVSGVLGLNVSSQELENMTLDTYTDIVATSLLRGAELVDENMNLEINQPEEELIDKEALLREVEANLGDVKGPYRLVFEADTDETLASIAFQMNSSSIERTGVISTVGQRIADIAIKLYPNVGPSENSDIRFQKEETIDNSEDSEEETVPIKENYTGRGSRDNAAKQLLEIVDKYNIFSEIQKQFPKFSEAVSQWVSDNERIQANKGRVANSLRNVRQKEDTIRTLISAIGTTSNLLEDMHKEFVTALKIEIPLERVQAVYSIRQTSKSFSDMVDLIDEVSAQLAIYEPLYTKQYKEISSLLSNVRFYYNAIEDGYLRVLKPDLATAYSEKSDFYRAVKEQKDKLEAEKKQLQQKQAGFTLKEKNNTNNPVNKRLRKVNTKLSQLPTPERFLSELEGSYEDISTLQLYTVSRSDSDSALVATGQVIANEVDFKNNQHTMRLANEASTMFNKLKRALGFSNANIEEVYKPIVRQTEIIDGFDEEGNPQSHFQDILLNQASPAFYSRRDALVKKYYSFYGLLANATSPEEKATLKRKQEQAELELNEFYEKYTSNTKLAQQYEIDRLLKEDLGDGKSVNEHTFNLFDRLQDASRNIESTNFLDSISQDARAAGGWNRKLNSFLEGLNEPTDSIEYKIADRLSKAIALRDSIGSFELTDKAKESYEKYREWRIKAWADGKLEDAQYFKWFQYNSNIADPSLDDQILSTYQEVDKALANPDFSFADTYLQIKEILDGVKDKQSVVDGNMLRDKTLLRTLENKLNTERRNVTNPAALIALDLLEGNTAVVDSIYYDAVYRDKINELVVELTEEAGTEQAARVLAEERIKETAWYKENHIGTRPRVEWRIQFDPRTNVNYPAGENYKSYKLFPENVKESKLGPDGKVTLNDDPSNPYIDPDYAKLRNENQPMFEFLTWATDFYVEQQKNYHPSRRNGYLLPSMRQPGGERLQNFLTKPIETIQQTLGDIQLNEQEKEQNYGTGERIPVRFSGMIDTKDQSKDVVGSILMYSHFANRFTELKKVEPLLVGAKDMLEGVTSKTRLSGKGGAWSLITGAYHYIKGTKTDPAIQDVNQPSNTAKAMNLLVKEVLYGNYDDKFELPVIGGDANELVRNVLGIASKGTFFGNVLSPIKNMWGGEIQQVIYANIKGGAFTYGDYAQGKVDFAKFSLDFSSDFLQGKFGNKSLVGQIFDRLDLLQGEIYDEYGKKTQWTALKEGNQWLLGFKNFAEFEIQATQSLAFLNAKKVKQGDKLISLLDAYDLDAAGNIKVKDGVELSETDEFAFAQTVQKYQRDMNGAYRKSERNASERTFAGKLFFYMNKYFVPMFTARFRPEYYNIQLGQSQEGFHYATGRFLLDTLVQYRGNIVKAWDTASEEERTSITRTAKELAIIIMLATAASHMGMGDNDERKKNSDVENYVLGLTIGAYSEARSFIFPSDYYNKFNNALFALRPIGTAINLVYDSGATLAGSQDAYFQKDSTFWEKGDSKAIADALRLFGFTGTTFSPEDFAKNTELALKLRN